MRKRFPLECVEFMPSSSRFITKEKFSGWTQSAFSDRLFWLFFCTWALPLLVSVIYVLLNFSGLPSEIPLFYSRVWGETQLAKQIYILLPTIGAILLGIFDLGLAITFHAKDKVFAYLLSATASLVAILVLVTTFNIINLIR